MFLVLHNPEPNGVVRVQEPANAQAWTVLGVAATAEEALDMANDRAGAYIGVDLRTGDVADVFAYSLTRRSIPKP